MNERRAFSATPVLDGLTGFQRNTVEHVIDRFYGPDPHDRFLVADETGLGKTMVARGVIARTIEELQHHDHVDRIDVVYVCSNQDLAQQNLSKLNVTGSDQLGIASRLTLLAKHLHAMGSSDGLRKPVNLVSFTPGTSFTKGSHTGKAEERAMLYLLLRDRLHLRGVRRGTRARRVLRGTLESPDGIADRVRRLEAALPNGLNPQIQEAFLDAADQAGLLDQFEDAMAQVMRLKDPRPLVTPLVSELRNVLARASVATLTPDLVILDEFQRFRELTDPTTEAGELAHHLFRYRDEASDHRAKVLLLSATPLKPFTYAEEADLGDDHHRDFLSLVEFLANGDARITDGVRQALHDYRSAVVTGRAAEGLTATVRDRLLQVMSRTERPRAVLHDQTTEIVTDLGTPPADDLLGFVALKDLARTVEAPFSIEYWKSAPYFVNFMDGYKLADRVRAGLGDPLRADAVRERLSRTQRIDFAAVDQNAPIPLSNPRLRALAEDTIGAGWWKLLWVPPSLPYLTPDGPYAEPWATAMTKLLVFSSWTATPTAVASLLSYEADRMTAGDALGATPDERRRERDSRRTRLNYRIDRDDDRDRPSSMSTLALFWPAPGLAALADPRAAHRHNRTPASPLSAADLVADVAAALASETADDPDDSGEGPIASAWFEILRRTDSFPPGLSREQVRAAWDGADAAAEVASAVDDPESAAADADERATDSRGRHVDLAFDVRGRTQDRRVTDDTRATVAELAAHGPGTIAYRALGRVAGDHPGVTDAGLWRAAVRVASALRTLFSRPETTLLLDHLIPGSPPEVPYWRKILTYCAWGNLQAALDEHVHHLHVSQGAPALDDDSLQEFAALVAEPLVLRASRYEVFDPDRPDERPRFPVRFALRYGGKNEGQENERQPVLRRAFNSPFWPFVLATTSVGQEGVDFHWWSHALLHWNTPANPVDFEQREGRVDRYDGHAVRKNLAARHRGAILGSEQPDPWRAAYELAREDTGDLGEFAPHWVFPGEATIQRHVAPYLLSVDETRLADIKRDVALYRMTFGQPRQEDLLEMLRRRLSEASSDALAALHLDLSAPAAPPRAPDPEPSPVGDPYEDEADPESQQSEAEPATGPVGDWYVAFGADDQGRQWEDGRRYGFVSAGGGQWYSRTLRHVPAGARVWVYVPGRGYVAAGTTLGAAVRFDQLRVDINGELVRVAEQPLVGRYMHGAGPQTDDLAEWAIPVRWHVTVSVTDAFRESGLFANQNSACPLRDTPTLERLRDRFGDPSSD